MKMKTVWTKTFKNSRSEQSSEEQMESYFDLVKRFTTKKTLPADTPACLQEIFPNESGMSER